MKPVSPPAAPRSSVSVSNPISVPKPAEKKISIPTSAPVEKETIQAQESADVIAQVKVVVGEHEEAVVVTDEAFAEEVEESLPPPVAKPEETKVPPKVTHLQQELEKLNSVHELTAGTVIQVRPGLTVKILSAVYFVEWKDVFPYKKQPRKKFSATKLEQLAASMKEVGQIMPALIKCCEVEGYKWELVDGERRYRACGINGEMPLKAILVEVSSEQAQFVMSSVANFCREDHTPIEEAEAIYRHVHEFGYSKAKTARIFGNCVTWINQRLSLLTLPPEIQELIDPDLPKGEGLGTTVAGYIAELNGHDLQWTATKHILEKGLNVNQAFAYTRKLMAENGQVSKKKRTPSDDYRVLKALVQRIKVNLSIYDDMTPEQMYELFKHRPDRDRNALLDEVEEVRLQWKHLRELLIFM